VQNPKLKGIVITAYPLVETAVEAMKMGAVDYVVKPFAPDALEKSIEEVLGSIQVEVRSEEAKVEAAVTEASVVEEAEVEQTIAITEEEIPVYLEQGKSYFRAGRYEKALREFQSILHIAPGHMETRVWIQRTKEELAKPRVEVPEDMAAVEEVVKVNECVWSKMGVVSL